MPIRDDDDDREDLDVPENTEDTEDQPEVAEDEGGQEDLLEQDVPEVPPEVAAKNLPPWAYTDIPLDAIELAQEGHVETQRKIQMAFYPVVERVVRRIVSKIPRLREQYADLFNEGYEAAARAILDYKPIYRKDGLLAFSPGSAVYYRIKRAVDKKTAMELGTDYNTRRQLFKTLSMDAPIGEDGADEATRHEKIEDPQARGGREVDMRDLVRRIHTILDELPELQGQILRGLFYDNLSAKALRAKLGISQAKYDAAKKKAFDFLKSVYGEELKAAHEDATYHSVPSPGSKRPPSD